MPKRPDPAYKPDYSDPADTASPDVTPLEIILATMRQRYGAGDTEGAIALARIAAPYLHPRVTMTASRTDLAAMPDADLDKLRPSD